MFLLNIIPGWARILALLALVGAVWGHGYWKGHEGMADKLQAVQLEYAGFKADVDGRGKAQAALTAKTEAKQKEITDAMAQEYGRRLAALPRFNSVRQPPTRSDGSAIPTFSCPPSSPDATASNDVPVESVPKADFDALRTDAAVTTLMLVKLQEWALEQQKASPEQP